MFTIALKNRYTNDTLKNPFSWSKQNTYMLITATVFLSHEHIMWWVIHGDIKNVEKIGFTKRDWNLKICKLNSLMSNVLLCSGYKYSSKHVYLNV